MNRIELAVKRYQDIVTEEIRSLPKSVRYRKFPIRELLAWIENDVCQVVEDYLGRITFRSYLNWPIDVLCRGTGTEEREAVKIVQRNLRNSATALIRLAGGKRVAEQMESQDFASEVVVEEEVRITGGEGTTIKRKTKTVSVVDELRPQIECFAAKKQELVCLYDYFYPRTRVCVGEDDPSKDTQIETSTLGMMIPSINPELLPIGDFVTRCLFRRVDHQRELLQEFRTVVYRALTSVGRLSKKITIEQREWEDLSQSCTRLRRLCAHGREFQLRDSCVALTQLFAAIRPNGDLSITGLPPDLIERCDVAYLRHQITTAHDLETFDRIVAALSNLLDLYRNDNPEQAELEKAIATGGLVLCLKSQTAYWEESALAVDWWVSEKAQWKFLVGLAEQARKLRDLGREDLYGSRVGRSAMPTCWGRLAELLPTSLEMLVESNKKGGYRLEVSRNRIFIFRDL